MLERLNNKGFEILALHHAEAILTYDLPELIDDLEGVLDDLELPVSEIIKGGGGEGVMTQRLRRALAGKGWRKHRFEIKKTVDGVEREFISHEIDHVKHLANGTAALEIEWNNKDPFFDRDLENFKRLHVDGVISIGVIITRGSTLHADMRSIVARFAKEKAIRSTDDLALYYTPTPRQLRLISNAAVGRGSFEEGWAHAFVSDKYGEATTHWRKLEDRVKRGVGNPCPLLLVGLPSTIVKF